MKSTLAFILFFLMVAGCCHAQEPLAEARRLYEQEDYLAAARVLESVEDPQPAEIFLLWQVRRKIGGLASPSLELNPEHPDYPYYQYVKERSEVFGFEESLSQFVPSGEALERIKKLDPQSPFIPLFRLVQMRELETMLAEDGWEEEDRLRLISEYQRLAAEMPVTKGLDGSDVNARIQALEQMRDLPSDFLTSYSRKFEVDADAYRRYIDEWLQTRELRRYAIRTLRGKTGVAAIEAMDMPAETREELESRLLDGSLVVISEAAFKAERWEGDKFVVYQRKEK